MRTRDTRNYCQVIGSGTVTTGICSNYFDPSWSFFLCCLFFVFLLFNLEIHTVFITNIFINCRFLVNCWQDQLKEKLQKYLSENRKLSFQLKEVEESKHLTSSSLNPAQLGISTLYITSSILVFLYYVPRYVFVTKIW